MLKELLITLLWMPTIFSMKLQNEINTIKNREEAAEKLQQAINYGVENPGIYFQKSSSNAARFFWEDYNKALTAESLKFAEKSMAALKKEHTDKTLSLDPDPSIDMFTTKNVKKVVDRLYWTNIKNSLLFFYGIGLAKYSLPYLLQNAHEELNPAYAIHTIVFNIALGLALCHFRAPCKVRDLSIKSKFLKEELTLTAQKYGLPKQ